MKCLLCGATAVDKLGPVGHNAISVTSDCKLVPSASEIYGCRMCGHLQKSQSHQLLIDRVYKNYDAHHLSAGNEQPVFVDNRAGISRSEYVLARLIDHLPESGKLLDIGTGNGAVLKSAQRLLPRWDLFAFDIEGRFEQEVLAIPNVREFNCGDLDRIPKRQYDMIVLWHVVEHVREPVALLNKLGEMISDKGFIIVQVPDVGRNPFDMAVIDHCSHFRNSSIAYLMSEADLEIIVDGSDWIHNCITVMARKAVPGENTEPRIPVFSEGFSIYEWLNATTRRFNKHVEVTGPDYYLFGTGMASLYLYAQLSEKPLAFIDEDPHKVGSTFEGTPVIPPDQVEKNRPIVMPFLPLMGAKIEERLTKRYENISTCPVRIPENLSFFDTDFNFVPPN